MRIWLVCNTSFFTHFHTYIFYRTSQDLISTGHPTGNGYRKLSTIREKWCEVITIASSPQSSNFKTTLNVSQIITIVKSSISGLKLINTYCFTTQPTSRRLPGSASNSPKHPNAPNPSATRSRLGNCSNRKSALALFRIYITATWTAWNRRTVPTTSELQTLWQTLLQQPKLPATDPEK